MKRLLKKPYAFEHNPYEYLKDLMTSMEISHPAFLLKQPITALFLPISAKISQ
jgi:hypothetical protein